jgi:hypothetical protein
MNGDFGEWHKRVLDAMRWSLSPYEFEERGTGSDDNFRAFYKWAGGEKKNQGFIVHLRPSYTKNKINICLGASKDLLKVPGGYPVLRPGDNSNQCQFDIFIDKPYDWPLAFLLAVQVADERSKRV